MLAGSPAQVGSGVAADCCGDCGATMDQCACGDDGACADCGCADCECEPHAMPMENADYDHGHVAHNSEGEAINPDEFTWQGRYAPGTQSFVKGGDNPLLIKEDADLLFSKLRKEYRDYIAEAELARSNAGDASPLTANNRDEFDKDPFANKEPVTDGTHSPLSTIERQHVAK